MRRTLTLLQTGPELRRNTAGRSWRGMACLGAVLLASGCTMIPKYERPEAPVPAQYPGTSQTQPGEAAEITWQAFIKDERLRGLVALALENNRDLRVAALRVEQTRAQYRISRSELYPSVYGGGSYTRARINGETGDQWTASLGSTAYEVDLWGRVRSLNRQALENYLATEEARRGAQISLVAEVAVQYFAMRQAEAQLGLARQTLHAVQDSFRLTQATFDAGAASALDVRTAEGQVQTARINVVTYERLLALAREALVFLVGRPLPDGLPTPAEFDNSSLLAEIPAGLPSELLQRRPDILQAEHLLQAANANIGAARAAFFPAITLTATLGTSSAQLSQLFGSGTGLWSFSPQVTLPIFTGGRNRANLEAAEIGKRIEIATYERAIQIAFREVADALVANSTFAQQIEEEEARVVAQQKRYDLAVERYREGEDPYLNVLTAQQDLYLAQQSLLQARFNKLASQVSLYTALGGGWQ